MRRESHLCAPDFFRTSCYRDREALEKNQFTVVTAFQWHPLAVASLPNRRPVPAGIAQTFFKPNRETISRLGRGLPGYF
ncbi:hypothetical protein [Methylotuvimicrobium sp.]|uniref:hypothetical protein n=1 Tax=Methylotuvimicrobium sp. TaxID=2822413 RepID=UPI003D65760E